MLQRVQLVHEHSCSVSRWAFDLVLSICFQATHQLKDKEQLMGFLRKSPEGTHLGQISDAYPSVSADIAHLQKEVIPAADIMQLASLMQGEDRRWTSCVQ